MKKLDSTPEFLDIDEREVFHLSIVLAWSHTFPAKLREHARYKLHHLPRSLQTWEISDYGLLSCAYIGLAPLPVNYGRFMIQSERLSKAVSPVTDALKDAISRENSATDELEMRRGELKRLLKHLDGFAMKFGGVDSYARVFNCRDEILSDTSPFAPQDRETYADGPLYLWDFSKAVNEHKLVDMAFGTFSDWVLFLHLDAGVVYGHAICPRAHRFGNFTTNPLIDFVELLNRKPDTLSPIIAVPLEVQQAIEATAQQQFPGLPFKYVPPPLYYNGHVLKTADVMRELPHFRLEA